MARSPVKLKAKWNLKASQISPGVWNRLAENSIPMMRWEWFAALESPGAIHPKAGFTPNHLVVSLGRKILAIVPLYWKKGYLADWTSGGAILETIAPLQSKSPGHLIGTIPFTPVPGYHFLMDPAQDASKIFAFILQEIKEVISAQKSFFQAQHVDSGWKPFLEKKESAHWVEEKSFTYRWLNCDYPDFEAFLQTFPSRRRNKIRREIAFCQQPGISFRILKGKDISSDLMKEMFDCYNANIEKHYSEKGNLQWPFWNFLQEHFQDHLHLVRSEERGETLGMNLAVESPRAIFGRWWGAKKEVPFLHFNHCYYIPIRYAIEHKKKYIDPGYQGRFKKWRGFEPVDDISYLYTKDESVRGFLQLYLAMERDAEVE